MPQIGGEGMDRLPLELSGLPNLGRARRSNRLEAQRSRRLYSRPAFFRSLFKAKYSSNENDTPQLCRDFGGNSRRESLGVDAGD